MIKLKCKKSYNNFIGKDHLTYNNIDCGDDNGLYIDLFEEGKEYKCTKVFDTYSGAKIVYISSHIKHHIGKPDYEKFISQLFYIGRYDGRDRIEEYFDIEDTMEFKFASKRTRDALNINVVNMNNHDATDWDYYIGRPSPLSNPYSHKEGKYVKLILSSREEALDIYKNHFKKYEKTDEFQTELQKIIDIQKEYGAVNLVCFCKPKSCHGDHIKHKIENIILCI